MSEIKNKSPSIALKGVIYGAVCAIPYFVLMLYIFTSPQYHELITSIINNIYAGHEFPVWLRVVLDKNRVVGNTFIIFLFAFFICVVGHSGDYELKEKSDIRK